ncbi:MAG: GxxExxY protein [Verrucomicrobia bacterium]|nr:MAG: GxxExxY protein [Verrucomicrobiota bacterium]
MKTEIIHEKLSGAIIGAAMDVLNELKPGLDEKLYERVLVIELRRRGHTVDAQRSYPVFYNSDLIVDDTVIVDPKVVSAFNEAHTAQMMIGYLAISQLDLALLLNFKSFRLEWKRIVRQNRLESDPPDLHAEKFLSATSA